MGAAYARLLAEAGAKVVLADIAIDKATAVAELIRGVGGSAVAIKVDVASPESCTACVDQVTRTWGPARYLVNNAGLLNAALDKPLHQIEYERFLHVMAVNMNSVLLMTKAVFPSMREAGGGAIVNTSSIGAWQTSGVYSVSKLGVNALTVNLARELLPFGIRVNAIAPGTTNTEGMAPILSVEQMGQWAQSFGKPTNRVAEPQDIARVGMFLLSDAANYIAGQILAVDEAAHVRV
jgi:3-oxoacyl-[acyl-carrier protein] reductase